MSRWAVLVPITLAHALGALAVLSFAPLSPFLLDALQLSVVDRTRSYAWPWLGLACVGVAVAATLPWPAPLVEREPGR